MHRYLISRTLIAASVVVCVVLQAPRGSQGQTCRGDIDGDGRITANDLAVLIAIISGEPEAPTLKARADVNGDGAVSAGDIPVLIQLQGEGCSAQTATPSARPTSSPTPTTSPTMGTVSPTSSPTVTGTPQQTATTTPTPTATQTPTPTCVVLPAPLGITNGALTANDCQQRVDNQLRYTDVYTVTGSPGQAITVQLTATGPSPTLAPYVLVVDPDGQFFQVEGAPPIQFVVSTSQPYKIVVTSAPSTSQQTGPYQLTLTQSPCPTPIALTIPGSVTKALTATDCPDPGAPSNPAHVYTFQVPSVPMNIAIVMRQIVATDTITPVFSVLNPDGIELVTQSNNFDCTPSTSTLLCAQARFLALQPGKYTIIAAGGIGQYSLQLSSPTCKAVKALSSIPSAGPLTCPGQSGPGCAGTLSGNTSTTSCAAPLPIPGISDSAPAVPSSPADLYTFTAAAGDVISVGMTSDNDAHLYLLGPAPGNQLVAQDDNSLGGTDAQLAATLVQPGPYTIVAANNNALQPTDPAVNYTLLVQKCPVRGTVPFGTGVWLHQTFSDSDCVGFGGVPYRTYSFTGTAGEFVAAGMISTDVNAFIRMFAPDGSVVVNNDDLLASSSTTDAQVNRILPATGTYFVEVSTNGGVDTVPFFSPPAFAVGAQTCPATTVTPGPINAAFTDADCQATDGTPFDVFGFTPATTPRAASMLPPSNGCAVALLAEGAQTPDGGCSAGLMDFPTLSNQTYGFIIAATDPAARGPYTAQLTNCPLSLLTFGDIGNGSLTPSNCTAADGTPAGWFLVKAPADLVRFSQGVSGTVTASFSVASALTDAYGSGRLNGTSFVEDPTQMYSFGTDLAALLRVGGKTPADRGAYTVSINPAALRQ
ncbi:MAG: pre-peptidase C-terminal domain-containing protein [Candidatus Binatia bacterium]